MLSFKSYPQIGEIIFSYLDLQTLLNCQFVCQDWKEVLENPHFWLKKLKEIRHPIKIDQAWKKLISKSIKMGINKSIFAECLKLKFKDYIFAQEKSKYARKESIFQLKCPPLYTASKYGFLEIVELIYKLGLDKNRRIYWKNNPKWPKGNYFDMPI